MAGSPLFDFCIRLLLLPLLAFQAVRVRKTAQALAEPQGPRAVTDGNGPSLRSRIIGDSSAAGVGVTQQSDALAGQLSRALAQSFTVTWVLDAKTGETTKSTLARLTKRPAAKADIVICVLGANDATRLTQVWLRRRRQRRLMARIKTLYAPDLTYLTAVPPLEHFPLLPNPLRWCLGRHARALDLAQQTLTTPLPDIIHLPFQYDPQPEFAASDGFHPSAVLYQIWAKEMASRICADWPKSQHSHTGCERAVPNSTASEPSDQTHRV